MQITFLGGADEVGASCILIEIGGRRLLVDAGIRPSPKARWGLAGDQLPDLSQIERAGGLDAILVTHAHTDKVPADFVRKQTLKNAERYITDELKRYESEVLTAAERAKTLETQLYEEVRLDLCRYVPILQAAAGAIALLDVLVSLGALAVHRRFPWAKVVPYCLAQLAGAFVASAVVYVTYHDALDAFDGGVRQGS